jgi:hypothetical protein
MDKLIIFDCDGLSMGIAINTNIQQIAKDNSWEIVDILEFEAFIFVEVK